MTNTKRPTVDMEKVEADALILLRASGRATAPELIRWFVEQTPGEVDILNVQRVIRSFVRRGLKQGIVRIRNGALEAVL